jgi:CheY-like chemotaxis protein
VRTAEEAVEALEGGDFDCLVVDLVLPGDDGIQFLDKVRANGRSRELPVIVYTGKISRPKTTRR